MFKQTLLGVFVAGLLSLLLPSADAGLINFETSADLLLFDGDGVTDSAGPFVIGAESGTITTNSLVGGTALGFDGSLGLGVGDGDFDFGDSWGFSWDIDTVFEGISTEFQNASSNVTVQSDAWKTLAIVTNPSANVEYDAVSGTFTLNGSQTDDTWSVVDFTGGANVSLFVMANTDIVFTNITSSENNLELRSLTFGGPPVVPEPGTMLSFLVCSIGYSVFRRRRADDV